MENKDWESLNHHSTVTRSAECWPASFACWLVYKLIRCNRLQRAYDIEIVPLPKKVVNLSEEIHVSGSPFLLLYGYSLSQDHIGANFRFEWQSFLDT